MDEENGRTITQNAGADNVSYTLGETKEELFDLVDRTGEPYSGGVVGANLVVGANQDMIEKVINSYRRKMIIHVDGSGDYSLTTIPVRENE